MGDLITLGYLSFDDFSRNASRGMCTSVSEHSTTTAAYYAYSTIFTRVVLLDGFEDEVLRIKTLRVSAKM